MDPPQLPTINDLDEIHVNDVLTIHSLDGIPASRNDEILNLLRQSRAVQSPVDQMNEQTVDEIFPSTASPSSRSTISGGYVDESIASAEWPSDQRSEQGDDDVDIYMVDSRDTSPVQSDSESVSAFEEKWEIDRLAEELKNEPEVDVTMSDSEAPPLETVDEFMASVADTTNSANNDVEMHESEQKPEQGDDGGQLDAPEASQLPPAPNHEPLRASGESDGSLDANIEKFKKYFREGYLSYVQFTNRSSKIPNYQSYGTRSNTEKKIVDSTKFWAQQPDFNPWFDKLSLIANIAGNGTINFLPGMGIDFTKTTNYFFTWGGTDELFRQIKGVTKPIIIERNGTKLHRFVNLNFHIVFMMMLAKNRKIKFIEIPDGGSIDLDPSFSDDTASTFQFIDMAAALPS